MKTLARLFALLFAATLFTAPLPVLAQQKQDTMDKKDSSKKSSKKNQSDETTKKSSKKDQSTRLPRNPARTTPPMMTITTKDLTPERELPGP